MYQKNTKKSGMPNRLYHKFLLVMRLTTVILIASLMQVSAAGLAQKITLSKSNAPLRTVLRDLKSQSGYKFLYTDNLLRLSKPVDIKVSGVDFQEVLKQVFRDQPLTYSINENTITIKEREEPSFLDRVIERFVNIDVTGKVVDEQGRAIAGASVIIKSTGKGISTEVDGTFTLKNVAEGSAVLIKYIGYETKEVSAMKEVGVIRLQVATNELDQVQIQAYTKSSRRLSTSNITTVKAEDIEKQPVTNPLLALQGRVPGLQITQATGTPGSTLTIRIQGVGSLLGSSEPFFVIDGIPFNSTTIPMGGNIGTASANVWGRPSSVAVRPGGVITTVQQSTLEPAASGNPFSFLNPMDIESIEILKDADATAIYGSRAANGAILITTKKGSVGKLKVDLDLTSGINQVISDVALLNSEQYLQLRREAVRNFTNTNQAPSQSDYDLLGVWDTSRFTDWQKLVFDNTSGFNRVNVGLSGGNVNTSFRVGLGYNRQNSMNPIAGFNDQQLSGSINIDTRSNNQKFRAQFSASYFRDNNKLPATDLTARLLYLSPVAPALFNGDGSLNKAEINGSSTWTNGNNPIASLYNKFSSLSSMFATSAKVSYQVLNGLEINATLGYNTSVSEQYANSTIAAMSTSQMSFLTPNADFGHGQNFNYNIEPQITYSKQIGKSKFNFLMGSSMQQRQNKTQNITASGQLNDTQLESLPFGTSFVTTQNSSIYKYLGVFGNASYSFAEKYLLNFTMRRDGSSRFGPASRFHTFAAVGAGWIFTEEKFMKERLPALSFGKIKASYGSSGNDGIGDYSFMDLHTVYSNPSASIPYQTIGLTPTRLINKDLQWESNKKMNFGVDLGFFRDRFFVGMNYTDKRSSNLLQYFTLADQVGIGQVIYNFPGTIKNTSLEFSISSNNIKSNSFNWRTSINLTVPKNKLLSLDQTKLFLATGARSRYIVGQPLSVLYGYHFLGVDPQSGLYVIEDKNGNPTMTPKEASGNDLGDNVSLINPASKFYGGIENTFSYKNFSFSFLIQFVDQMKERYMQGFNAPGISTSNQPAIWLDRWRKPGDITALRKPSVGLGNLSPFTVSDAYFQDASFARLKNVALSYNLPKSLSNRLGLQQCAISLQSQNLFTVTKYSGLDPESGNSLTPPYQTTVLSLRASF